MGLTQVLSIVGGVGMFLYGMNLLGEALRNITGDKLEALLEKLTSGRVRGLFLGTLITGLIQSSAATSIIVLGFVNAGIMTLYQGVPVIFGANIGSTVTGQILRLGDISSESVLLTLLKPSSFAPVIIAIGAFILLFTHDKRQKDIARILIGFGILFMGMSTMEQTMSATLRGNPQFQAVFTRFSNPVLGILAGMLLTAAIQSSSASVGILQALSVTGDVTFSSAWPIILGQNIGKCVTVWLGSIGTNKKAKRAAFLHLAFNVIGVVVFGALVYGVQFLFGLPFWGQVMNRGNIADIHSLFNLATAFLLLPFTNQLIDWSGRLFRDSDAPRADQQLDLLDDLFIKNPPIALDQCRKVLLGMENAVQENFGYAWQLITQFDPQKLSALQDNEHFLDRADSALNEYLIKISGRSLSGEETRLVSEMMHLVGDLERIGDYCEKIAQVAQYNSENHITFSEEGQRELRSLMQATQDVLSMVLAAHQNDDSTVAQRVEPLSEVISLLKEELTNWHVQRLQRNECTVQAGISFGELIANAQRISSHCANMAIQLLIRLTGSETFDYHNRLSLAHGRVTDEYKALFKLYESTYYQPLVQEAGQAPAAPRR